MRASDPNNAGQSAAAPPEFGRTVPAPLIFVGSGIAQYAGAACAVLVFGTVSPAAVAWLRVVVGAIALCVIVRPRFWRWTRRHLFVTVGFGLITAGMNVAYYEAISRLPLGTATAMEFLGPVLVAAINSRSRRDIAGLALAVGGIALLADVRWSGSPLGVVMALLAGALWAGYIAVGKRVADDTSGAAGIAVGLAAAAVVTSPLAIGTGPVWHSAPLVLSVIAVGVLSTAIPYGLDQLVMRRMGRGGFAMLLAILPATAAVIGVVALRQIPGWSEVLGIAMVVIAVWTAQSRWRSVVHTDSQSR